MTFAPSLVVSTRCVPLTFPLPLRFSVAAMAGCHFCQPSKSLIISQALAGGTGSSTRSVTDTVLPAAKALVASAIITKQNPNERTSAAAMLISYVLWLKRHPLRGEVPRAAQGEND